jgi:hypothetical protein
VAKAHKQNSKLYSLVEFKIKKKNLFERMPSLINSIWKVSMALNYTSETGDKAYKVES